MRDQSLLHHVELVDADVVGADVERNEGLADWQPPQRRHRHLDDEVTAPVEVCGRVAEALHLLVLGQQVRDGVVHEVDERERAVDPGRRHVADRHGHTVRTGFGPQAIDHRPGELEAGDVDARARLSGRATRPVPTANSSGLDHLRPARPGTRRSDRGRRAEHLGGALVVARRDSFVEDAVGHGSGVFHLACASAAAVPNRDASTPPPGARRYHHDHGRMGHRDLRQRRRRRLGARPGRRRARPGPRHPRGRPRPSPTSKPTTGAAGPGRRRRHRPAEERRRRAEPLRRVGDELGRRAR